MSHHQKIVEQRFSCLELEGRRVEVMEYSTKDHVYILLDALREFDPDFKVNYRTKLQLRKMTIIR